MLRIELLANNVYKDEDCFMCGNAFDAGDVLPQVFEGDSRHVEGYVCPDCMEAGPAGMADKLRDKAAQYREVADNCERWATEPVSVPTPAELHAAEIAFQRT